MDAEQCVAFLSALKCQKIFVKANGWVEACCPLAPWRHEKGADHTPSFGLAIKPGGRSHYSCFACQSGSAEELIQTLEMYGADGDYATCRKLLEDEPSIIPLPAFQEFPPSPATFVEWPQYWLDSFKGVAWSFDAKDYLLKRGVEQKVWNQFDLRYDSKRQMVVCPFRNVFGRLAGARGRSILDGTTGALKHFDYSWENRNNCRSVWYNEEVLNLPGPVVVVEGQFDCWRTVQAYPKVVANLTAKPTLEKMKKLGDCDVVLQIPDNDAAGKASTLVYASYCYKLGLEHRVLWLDEGVKDPDEAHPEYLQDRIQALLA